MQAGAKLSLPDATSDEMSFPTDHVGAFRKLTAQLDVAKSGNADFRSLFAELKNLAETGFLDACGLLAELQAVEPDVYDPAAAYKWYYIALKRDGFLTDYANENGSDESYLGPVGDFRNEPMVSDLIQTLGVGSIPRLDDEAEQWLAAHSPTPGTPGEKFGD